MLPNVLDFVREMTLGNRIALIAVLAVTAHLLVLGVRKAGAWILDPGMRNRSELAKRRPKLASIITLVVSSLTFLIYFGGFGIILGELGISLTAYFASATVIGLAVGFGSQGLVQDIVIGLTLIFSDVIDVGDVADIGGQTGRVESIGLRFTVLRTLVEQKVFVPNRNVVQINRYRHGYVRAYVDVQVPEGVVPEELESELAGLALAFRSQHPDIVLFPPEISPAREVEGGAWSYVRIKFKIWPGQGPLIETIFRQRALASLRRRASDYADWMMVVTYRARD